MIALNNIRFKYPTGDFQLRLPRLNIARGCTAACIGPSGSGKTTLLHLICGIITPQQGHIEVDGVKLNRLIDQPRRAFRIANVGLVFQEFELLEYLSVLDNILLPFRITSALTLDRRTTDRAKALAEQVGLSDKGMRRPRQLSQGERQRIAVCRALLAQPKLLLADEPTGNLDPSNKGRVLDILFDYARSAEATFLMVTHDHDLLSRFDRVIDCQDWSEPDRETNTKHSRQQDMSTNDDGGHRER